MNEKVRDVVEQVHDWVDSMRGFDMCNAMQRSLDELEGIIDQLKDADSSKDSAQEGGKTPLVAVMVGGGLPPSCREGRR